MRVTGGPPQTLAPARRALGASWSPSGDIVFAAERGATISRVAETGGDPVVIRRANERKGWAARPLAARASRRAPVPLPGPQRRHGRARHLPGRPRAARMPRTTGVSSPPIPTSSSARATSRSCAAGNCTLSRSTRPPGARRAGVSHRRARGSGSVRRRVCDVRVVGQRRARPIAAGSRPIASCAGSTARARSSARSTTRGNSATWPCRGTASWWRTSRWTRTSAHGTSGSAIWCATPGCGSRPRADEDGAPVWAPDGGTLVFGGLRDRQIAVLRESAAGGHEETPDQRDWVSTGLVAGRQRSWPWKSPRPPRAAT